MPTSPSTVVSSASYAGFWKRFVAFIIDGILISLIMSILGIVVHTSTIGMANPSQTNSLLQTIVMWLYFTLMESSDRQATVGKICLGIKVTDLSGNRITFLRATGRYFAKFLSAMILFVGYMMAGWTQKKQALHDMIAGTLVVNK